jgi:hypothetical protein
MDEVPSVDQQPVRQFEPEPPPSRECHEDASDPPVVEDPPAEEAGYGYGV